RKPIAATMGIGLGAAYLAGTYLQNLPLFGAVAHPRVAPGDMRFSLTFDDGPDPRHTPAISTLLAERGHRATFFALGRAARAHPALIRQLAADGHEIACHGEDHRLLAFAPPRAIVAQILAWEEAVETALGSPGARLIRTPHGARSPWLVSVARHRGYTVCGWDGSVFDTAEPGVETIAGRVVSLLRPGAVVLLHDGDATGCGGSRAQTVAALGPVLDAAERRGLRSETLGSLLHRSSASPTSSGSLARSGRGRRGAGSR
ncbi:MAG: polysaccharide deacetylase family protein, partial [Thermoleophilia bacterium]|nr:polysaccharide deacetylase family protein [Thermoleophilia bacterium]